MSKSQYKLTNTTKWPGVKKGKHKNGFILGINRKNLHVNRHMTVDEMSESIEALQKRRYLKVEVVENRSVTIKEELDKTQKENDALRSEQEKQLKDSQKKAQKDAATAAQAEADALKAAQQESEPASSLDKDALRQQVKGGMPENTARVAGEDDSVDPLGDLEEATGDNPNFVVQAGAKNKNKNKNKNK